MGIPEQKKMDTSKLKKFAQFARRSLIEQVGSKLNLVLKEESSVRRELPKVVAKLEAELKSKGKEQLIEQVAYIWFNRFCALRFMDVNVYNRIGVLSPAEGQFQPEILAEAKAGHIDESIVNEAIRAKIFGLLDGSIKSRDSQSEAYRLLIVAVCNDYHRIMPYLFERIEDYTELLMPDDLLSGNSILAYTREAMTPEACESVECIGWLYQFYISEKKNKVFEGLKNNKKITPENIPAATQLFTPHWIVRYLVENSLGRLWMLNNPNSKIIEQMDYYIKPIEEENDFLKINTPEEIKVCDPACGSGHMLTYAYDLFYAIYLDAGYDPVDIPELILTNNLYGVEIDERAAELAAFALSMKAIKGNPNDNSNNRRRFFRKPIRPNICRLESITFKEEELDEYIQFVGRDLFTQDLRATLKEFEEADNFGSLIQPTLQNAEDILTILETKDVSGQLFLTEIHKRVLQVIEQANYLSQKYHVVVANPPYMGGKGMNLRMGKWAKDNYPDSKSDLFAMFIERDLMLTLKSGFSAMINMQSWMFLSSFEKLRVKLLLQSTISSMAHLGARGFDSIGGEVVSTVAYVLENQSKIGVNGIYIRLVDGKSEAEKNKALLNAAQNSDCDWRYLSSAKDFQKISGYPIAYWATDKMRTIFESSKSIGESLDVRSGLSSADNDRFIRLWHEVSTSDIFYPNPSLSKSVKWVGCNKGGPFKKWYGNNSIIINWRHGGGELKAFENAVIRNEEYYFRESVCWTMIAGSDFSARYSSGGYVFDFASPSIFSEKQNLLFCMAFLNSPLSKELSSIINPTLNLSPGVISQYPYIEIDGELKDQVCNDVELLIDLNKYDASFVEESIDYKVTPLLADISVGEPMVAAWNSYIERCRKLVEESLRVEERINKVIISAYNINEQFDSKIAKKSITLYSNPSFRYAGSDESALEELFLSDVVRGFVSHAVGCMLARYSLDKEGLILASQSETIEEFLKQVPQPSFLPDDDNVIPIIDLEGDWFEDDICEKFKQFLKVTFGDENFVENLAFIENAIGKDINKYFTKNFYSDHVKRYKKRPIYWLFSSAKGTFNALIYMHRYRTDTVSVVLNNYLREFRTKLQARKESYEQIEISASASQKDKTQAIKAIDKINKVLDEVNEYERDILYPLAGQNIEIDLDDGVKHNYPLFGKALKKIAGLS